MVFQLAVRFIIYMSVHSQVVAPLYICLLPWSGSINLRSSSDYYLLMQYAPPIYNTFPRLLFIKTDLYKLLLFLLLYFVF